jgi:hypothetical protein
MATKPTQKTLAWLRNQDYTVAVVEHWNPFINRRQDLFGFADLIAFKPGDRALLIQATSGSNTASRVHKIVANEHAKRWIETGNRIIVIGWRELVAYKKDGTKAKRKRWAEKVIEITADHF